MPRIKKNSKKALIQNANNYKAPKKHLTAKPPKVSKPSFLPNTTIENYQPTDNNFKF